MSSILSLVQSLFTTSTDTTVAPHVWSWNP